MNLRSRLIALFSAITAPAVLAAGRALVWAGAPASAAAVLALLPTIAGATDTEFLTGATETVKRWASDLWLELPEQVFWNQYMGKDANSIIQTKQDLEGQPGDKITFTLARQLSGAAVTGDSTLEGNEEAISFYSDDVTIDQYRNAVRLKGKLSERRTAFSQRQTAKTLLKDWLADLIDDSIFTALSTSPTATRAVYGGDATSTATIEATDYLTLALITKAKTKARKATPQIFPVKIDGGDYFLLVVSPDVIHDLKTADPAWAQAQREAQARGNSNPLFSGAEGIWDGVVIRSSVRVSVATNWGAGTNLNGAENLFLGRQAGAFAWGAKPSWTEKSFDYANKVGYSIAAIFGVTKAVFNSVDHGMLTVRTARSSN